jgi:hypothetical protein
LEIDGQKFIGSLTRKEMSSSIYTKALGLRPENLHGFVPGYRGHPTIKYRLKEKININLDLQGKSVFTFERVVKAGTETLTQTLKCEIAGIREQENISDGNCKERKSRYTWIKVEGAEYELPKDEIVAWLEKFGNPVSELTEDKERDSSDSDDNEYHNGIYSIKMDLHTKPPQLLPISGKKIKIYYKGIAKRCVKCLETDHFKKDCTLARKDWMEYVSNLMFETGFDLGMLGDAKKYLEKWRHENKEKTNKMISRCEMRNEEKANKEVEKMLRREALKGQVQTITEILNNQSLTAKKKSPLVEQTEVPSTNTASSTYVQTEDEEKAKVALAESLQPNQKPATATDTEKKKRPYVRKNQKNPNEEGSGQIKTKK